MGSVSNNSVTGSLTRTAPAQAIANNLQSRVRVSSMTFDYYYYTRTSLDIIMISTFYCLLLVPNVHISGLFWGMFPQDTSGSRRTGRTLLGTLMHMGKDHGALVFTTDFLQVRRIRSRATTHEEIGQLNIASAQQQGRLPSLTSCTTRALYCMSSEHLCRSLNSFTTPLTIACHIVALALRV